MGEDNTFLWILLVGLGGWAAYTWYQSQTPSVNAGATTMPQTPVTSQLSQQSNASTGTTQGNWQGHHYDGGWGGRRRR